MGSPRGCCNLARTSGRESAGRSSSPKGRARRRVSDRRRRLRNRADRTAAVLDLLARAAQPTTPAEDRDRGRRTTRPRTAAGQGPRPAGPRTAASRWGSPSSFPSLPPALQGTYASFPSAAAAGADNMRTPRCPAWISLSPPNRGGVRCPESIALLLEPAGHGCRPTWPRAIPAFGRVVWPSSWIPPSPCCPTDARETRFAPPPAGPPSPDAPWGILPAHSAGASFSPSRRSYKRYAADAIWAWSRHLRSRRPCPV